MNKQIKYIVAGLILFIMIAAFTEKTNTIAADQCNIENTAFTGGEKLIYKLYYNYGFLWIPAGEVTFSVSETKENYEMKAIGRTYKSYENIFRVNDYFYTKVDKQSMLPKNFVRIVEEGNYRLYDSVYFDQKRNVAFSYHGKSKADAKQQIHRLENCMQDMISNLYYMRNVNLKSMKKGDNVAVEMFFDKEVFPIKIGYAGMENKEIKELGKYRTLKVIPDLVEGNVFKKGDHMSIWVSDDRNKIPLMIESPVSVGSIKAVLKSHSGLKYPFESKI